MEKLLKQYDKECLRMAMLKHEETFKEQVYELHRLYRIQKTLMKSIESSSSSSCQHGNIMHQNSRIRLDLERPAEELLHNNIVAESDDHGGDRRLLEVIDESEIELTLGPARYTPRKKHSDSGPSSFSSSSTESNDMNRTSSISRHKNITREQLHFQVSNIDLEEQLRQKRLKQPPPWFFQVLSMNMT